MKFANVSIVGLLAMALSTVIAADDDEAQLLYGQGVHAYFDGKLEEANALLTQAIEQDTNDPRPYYFRGIVQYRLGHNETADFQKGADLESSPFGRAFDVDDALERIQGRERIVIEDLRRQALERSRKALMNQQAAQYDPAQAIHPGGKVNLKNLPDVSSIVDPTIPFPDTSAKAYYPPTRSAPSASSGAATTVIDSAQPNSTPPADDPFNAGGNSTLKKAEQAPPPKEEKPAGDNNPFGGG